MSLLREQALKCPNSTFPSLNAGSSLIISFTPSLSTLLGTYCHSTFLLHTAHEPLPGCIVLPLPRVKYLPMPSACLIPCSLICTPTVHTPSLTSPQQSGFSAPTLPSAAGAHYGMNVPRGPLLSQAVRGDLLPSSA